MVSCEALLPCSGRQLVEQLFGIFQIARVQPLGEPAVDWRKQIAGLITLALVALEPRHAHCGAEFPGFGLLLTRNGKSTVKIPPLLFLD